VSTDVGVQVSSLALNLRDIRSDVSFSVPLPFIIPHKSRIVFLTQSVVFLNGLIVQSAEKTQTVTKFAKINAPGIDIPDQGCYNRHINQCVLYIFPTNTIPHILTNCKTFFTEDLYLFMAKRRMFSLDVIDTDVFLDMPAGAQNLYFHLGMRADDDGFISSPRRITSLVGSSPDDLRLLIAKGYIIPFDSGICVIRDWKVNNFLRSDRYTPTLHVGEKQQYQSMLSGSGITRGIPNDIPPVSTGTDSIGKASIGKYSIGKYSKEKENKEKDNNAQYGRKGVNSNSYSRTDNQNGVSQWNIHYDIDGTKI